MALPEYAQTGQALQDYAASITNLNAGVNYDYSLPSAITDYGYTAEPQYTPVATPEYTLPSAITDYGYTARPQEATPYYHSVLPAVTPSTGYTGITAPVFPTVADYWERTIIPEAGASYGPLMGTLSAGVAAAESPFNLTTAPTVTIGDQVAGSPFRLTTAPTVTIGDQFDLTPAGANTVSTINLTGVKPETMALLREIEDTSDTYNRLVKYGGTALAMFSFMPVASFTATYGPLAAGTASGMAAGTAAAGTAAAAAPVAGAGAGVAAGGTAAGLTAAGVAGVAGAGLAGVGAGVALDKMFDISDRAADDFVKLYDSSVTAFSPTSGATIPQRIGAAARTYYELLVAPAYLAKATAVGVGEAVKDIAVDMYGGFTGDMPVATDTAPPKVPLTRTASILTLATEVATKSEGHAVDVVKVAGKSLENLNTRFDTWANGLPKEQQALRQRMEIQVNSVSPQAIVDDSPLVQRALINRMVAGDKSPEALNMAKTILAHRRATQEFQDAQMVGLYAAESRGMQSMYAKLQDKGYPIDDDGRVTDVVKMQSMREQLSVDVGNILAEDKDINSVFYDAALTTNEKIDPGSRALGEARVQTSVAAAIGSTVNDQIKSANNVVATYVPGRGMVLAVDDARPKDFLVGDAAVVDAVVKQLPEDATAEQAAEQVQGILKTLRSKIVNGVASQYGAGSDGTIDERTRWLDNNRADIDQDVLLLEQRVANAVVSRFQKEDAAETRLLVEPDIAWTDDTIQAKLTEMGVVDPEARARFAQVLSAGKLTAIQQMALAKAGTPEKVLALAASIQETQKQLIASIQSQLNTFRSDDGFWASLTGQMSNARGETKYDWQANMIPMLSLAMGGITLYLNQKDKDDERDYQKELYNMQVQAQKDLAAQQFGYQQQLAAQQIAGNIALKEASSGGTTYSGPSFATKAPKLRSF